MGSCAMVVNSVPSVGRTNPIVQACQQQLPLFYVARLDHRDRSSHIERILSQLLNKVDKGLTQIQTKQELIWFEIGLLIAATTSHCQSKATLTLQVHPAYNLYNPNAWKTSRSFDQFSFDLTVLQGEFLTERRLLKIFY